MSDNDFLSYIHLFNSFSFLGRKRRFKYRTTNESMKRLVSFFDLNKNSTMLAVSGSGVQLLEVLSQRYRSPKAIIGFDYSPKQVAYNYLLKAGVICLSFEQFYLYFNNCDKMKNNKIKNIRKRLLKEIPKKIKRFLPKRHCFTKRDAKLNDLNGIKWLKNKKKYNNLKKNIGKIKFCEYEISHKNKDFSSILKSGSFDIIYLSNVLDWLCWHNKDIKDCKPLVKIIKNLYKISNKRCKIIITNLASRESFVPALIKRVHVNEKDIYKIYKYKWINYKIV